MGTSGIVILSTTIRCAELNPFCSKNPIIIGLNHRFALVINLGLSAIVCEDTDHIYIPPVCQIFDRPERTLYFFDFLFHMVCYNKEVQVC